MMKNRRNRQNVDFSTKQWVEARDRLRSRNLPIDEKGWTTMGAMMDLMFSDPQFFKDYEIYMQDSPFHVELKQAFEEVSNLLYAIQSHPAIDDYTFNEASSKSKYAIKLLQARRLSQLNRMIKDLRMLYQDLDFCQ